MAQVIAIDPAAPDAEIIRQAAAILRSGGLVAFPTETVYGLGADATDESAVRKIFEAKGRPQTNPLIVHCESVERVRRECVKDWPDDAQKLADAFWPGPLTLILPKSGAIPDTTTAGMAFVGVRIPANAVARALIAAADRPIAAPSANRSNRLSPTRAEHVAKDLGDRIGLILNAGPCSAGVESTVLDLSGEKPRILRPGPIRADFIESVLGKRVISEASVVSEHLSRISPGQSRLHYSPRKPLRIVSTNESAGESDRSTAVLTLGTGPADEVSSTLSRIWLADARIAERSLFEILHRWDADPAIRKIQVIFGDDTDSPEWAAVRDRVSRAASGGNHQQCSKSSE
ncbi:threonylcarbamoyl-AMP synthase [bacterium]|nr:threonylcarbamoyl-AMP synthase [bacterium]